MELTPVSELSSTTEYEEELNMTGITPDRPLPVESDSVHTKQQLEKENEELRLMCGYLGEACHRSRKMELEWQSFGKYTAEILKEELASSESRNRVTKDELEKLAKENKELKEMCLFLDHSGDGSQQSSLTPPDVMELMLHGKVAGEMNRVQGHVPRYTGRTEHTTLRDSEAIKLGVRSERNKEMALVEMKKRLERLETEKLELIKSVSAAHTLAAETNDASARSDGLPAHLQQRLDTILTSRKSAGRQQEEEEDENATLMASSDVILNAATLLDVVRRLEATTAAGGFSDSVAEGEAAALRLLVNIAWQKIQESVNM